MSDLTLAELRDELGRLAEQAAQIIKGAHAEERTMNNEEREKFDKIHERISQIQKAVEEREKYLEMVSLSKTPVYQRDAVPELGDPEPVKPVTHREAFAAYCRHGIKGMTAEQRDALSRPRYSQSEMDSMTEEQRVLITTTPSAGGYLVPEGFGDALIASRKFIGGVRASRATVWRTESGNPIPWPTTDDTGNDGVLIAENGDHSAGTDPTFGVVTFGASVFSSKVIQVSQQALQDTMFLEQELPRMLGDRVARVENTYFTTGTGSSQPQGVLTGATNVAACNGTAYTDLTALLHGLDPAYRPNGQWMFNDSTFQALRELLDGDNRPLWQPGLTSGASPTILGYPYIINQDMPNPTTGLEHMIFGDFSFYRIRDVVGVSLFRFDELYMENLNVGFLVWARSDGRLLDSKALVHGTHA